MRTSVHPNPPNNGDPDDTDEFPDCSGNVGDDHQLVIVDESGAIETTYQPGEWAAFTTVAAD